MSQQLHDMEGWEGDRGQEQSRPAPLQRILAAIAKFATRIRIPRFLAALVTSSADIEMSAGMDNTTTSSSMRVQRQKQNLYHSVPLLRGQFRLLQLLPNEDEDAAIHCRLFCTALDSRGTRPYEALSYVWGSGDKPRSIFVDGCDLAVGQNLYAALLHLRDPSIERTIWIDAICINQEDPEEKGHQVQSMAKIYAKATRVIVWLGEEVAGSSQALEEIRLAAAGNDQPVADIQTSAEPSTVQSDDSVEILALLQRPWFQRIWVLQEVAAAHHILIKCGSAEIDGFAFCSGLNALNLSDELRPDLRARILSVTYLIRGAIFRPNYATTCQTDNFSLDIRPLGELIEMYHTREATDRRDKVYALLGMSSDNPIAAGLSADYRISWKQLFNKLIHFSLSQLVSVNLSDNKEIALIEGKGCVIGEVHWVRQNATWKDKQVVAIIWRRGSVQYEFRCILPTTPKSIQKGDVVCLLHGASRPTILRPCNDHWAVIMIAVSLAGNLQGKVRDGRGDIKWSELLQSVTVFPHDFLLIWDWDLGPDRQQDQENHDYLASVPVTGHPMTELEGCLDAAARLRIVRLALQDGKLYKAAVEHLREEMTALDRVLRNMNILKKDCLGSENSGQEDAKKLGTMVNQLMEEKGPWELLKLAAKNGHEMFVKLLLDTDKFNWDSEELHKALCLAAENGHKAIVEVLLGTGQVDANRQRSGGDTALHLAAANGHEAVVKLLLNYGNVDTDGLWTCRSGPSTLHIAAKNGHEAVVQLLLDSGKVNADYQCWKGETPLHCAARNGHKAIVKLLLDWGIHTGYTTYWRGTALHLAAEEGHEAVVKLLLDSGKVDVNQQDVHDYTALHRAARRGYWDVVKLLLDTGKTDTDKQNAGGQTALHSAAEYGNEAVIKLLLDTGKIDTNKQDSEGHTALHSAAHYGDEDVVRLLLDTGKFDANIQNEDGRTALHLAAIKGYEAVVKLLLDTNKVDANEQSKWGETALHLAAKNGHGAIIKLLLDSGKVDVYIQDKEGKTALDIAKRWEYEAIAELLSLAFKEAGVKDDSTSS